MARPSIEMKLEVIVIPVADVERSKRFYAGLGWRLDADLATPEGARVVQFTPPGSPCSIHFGTGVTPAAPGSMQGMYLVVKDLEKARDDLTTRGVEVSEPYHRIGPEGPFHGLDPQRRSYSSYAWFNDPDGNGWVLQEITERIAGRVDPDWYQQYASPAGRLAGP